MRRVVCSHHHVCRNIGYTFVWSPDLARAGTVCGSCAGILLSTARQSCIFDCRLGKFSRHPSAFLHVFAEILVSVPVWPPVCSAILVQDFVQHFFCFHDDFASLFATADREEIFIFFCSALENFFCFKATWGWVPGGCF